MTPENSAHGPLLRLRRLGVHTHQEPVVYILEDSPVCRSEGFEAQSRVRIESGGRAIVATLNIVHGGLLAEGEAGLSEVAWRLLSPAEGAVARVFHAMPPASFSHVLGKIHGKRLREDAMNAVVAEIAGGRYSDVQLAAFVTTCAGESLDDDEIASLTHAMITVGERLTWSHAPIVDKHSVGGLPGNRTTPIVVAIIAACGLTMPKTSSRAITSPAGTADTMETMAPVDLDLAAMRRVVEAEGGCIVWGGSVHLSPTDDILIRVERALELDSTGQLVASILSKKAAAGATHVVVDMPVGATAKVRSQEAAVRLARSLRSVGTRVGLDVRVVVGDGEQPLGRGIGPALEAHDVLAVLQRLPSAPADLRDRSLLLAGEILEMAGGARSGAGREQAAQVLAGGAAFRKFEAICRAQGGMREPPVAVHRRLVTAAAAGVVTRMDNRRLSRVAKLAGAPAAAAAGIELHVRPRPGRRGRSAPVHDPHRNPRRARLCRRVHGRPGCPGRRAGERMTPPTTAHALPRKEMGNKTTGSMKRRARGSSKLEGSSATRFFHGLTPERILDAVESEGLLCTGRCLALNSLENRVYDVELELDEAPATPSDRFRVVKFYRPGRWSREQILEEHSFLLDLASREIPVVAPQMLPGERTLGHIADLGIHYAVFPRARGRIRDEISEDEAAQLGRLLARVHSVGVSRPADSRLRLDVNSYGRDNLQFLLESGTIPATYRDRYRSLVDTVCDRAEPWFEQTDVQSIHGDCHLGNVLWGSEGAMLVDFDDMLVGPCVQDLWLLAAGRDAWARARRMAIIEGYEEMRDFDRLSLRLIEPLRVLRLVHFCAWIARRWEDASFPRTFTDFGTDRFWVGQLEAIQEAAADENPFEEDYDS